MVHKRDGTDWFTSLTQEFVEPSVTILPVFEAVCHQLSFGQVIQPRQLAAAVSAGIKRSEALVTSLQLQRQKRKNAVYDAHKHRNMQEFKYSADPDWFLSYRVSPQKAKRMCMTAGKATIQS